MHSRNGIADDGTLNVLMVNAAQTGGGAGRVGELLAASLRRRGTVVKAFVRGSRRDDPHALLAGHWREDAMATRLARWGFPELGHVSTLLWPCRPEFAAADVLHLHNLHGDYLSLLGLPLWGWKKPVVFTLHDCWPTTGNCATPRACMRWRRSCGRCPLPGVYPMTGVDRSYLYRKLKPVLIRAAHPLVVSPSRWLADRFRSIPAYRQLPIRVVPHPLDCDNFRPPTDRAASRRRFDLSADRATILMIGANWDDPFKGAAHAIAALRPTAGQPGRVQLLIVGRGGDRVLAATGLPGRAVPFIHDRVQLTAAYACADVLLFPSLAENYPVSILEAMACGVPVVAYDVGGIPEQLEHGRTGLLVREGDCAGLSRGLQQLLSRRGPARGMGVAARTVVLERNASAPIAAAYERLYREAIRRWQRRGLFAGPRSRRTMPARAVARLLGWQNSPDGAASDPIAALPQVLPGAVT